MAFRMTPIGRGEPDLFLTGITREQKIVAMNGFRCLLPLILIFSSDTFEIIILNFTLLVFVTSSFVTF